MKSKLDAQKNFNLKPSVPTNRRPAKPSKTRKPKNKDRKKLIA